MNLTIRPNRLISEIQQEFNEMFPFLKLEFFRNKPGRSLDYSQNSIIRNNHKVSDGQDVLTDGSLIIKPMMTVKQLEKDFRNEFSLAVQVFRRSGNVWLETTMTDDWTLQHQNEHGRELSTEKKKEDKPEYDLNRGEE